MNWWKKAVEAVALLRDAVSPPWPRSCFIDGFRLVEMPGDPSIRTCARGHVYRREGRSIQKPKPE